MLIRGVCSLHIVEVGDKTGVFAEQGPGRCWCATGGRACCQCSQCAMSISKGRALKMLKFDVLCGVEADHATSDGMQCVEAAVCCVACMQHTMGSVNRL